MNFVEDGTDHQQIKTRKKLRTNNDEKMFKIRAKTQIYKNKFYQEQKLRPEHTSTNCSPVFTIWKLLLFLNSALKKGCIQKTNSKSGINIPML